jgi:hypothetical protein
VRNRHGAMAGEEPPQGHWWMVPSSGMAPLCPLLCLAANLRDGTGHLGRRGQRLLRSLWPVLEDVQQQQGHNDVPWDQLEFERRKEKSLDVEQRLVLQEINKERRMW